MASDWSAVLPNCPPSFLIVLSFSSRLGARCFHRRGASGLLGRPAVVAFPGRRQVAWAVILVVVLDDAFLADWCRRHLGARPVRVLFRSGNLSQVVAAKLADGRQVVVKARPSEPRIAGCTAVQRHLARAGFPCPEPLAGPVRDGGVTVTAEALIPGGSQLPAGGGAGPFAALLARLISSAPSPAEVPSLAPSPPWTDWDHPGPRLWPDRDDRGRDLNDTRGPAWVDAAAWRVRQRLLACAAPARIGHGDWESQNIRWSGTRPLAVHDWDSVTAQPEAALVGLAAAVGRQPVRPARPPASRRAGTSSPATSGRRDGSGRNRRSGTPGRPACGSACSTRRRTRPTAADRNSTASPARSARGWRWRLAQQVRPLIRPGKRPFLAPVAVNRGCFLLAGQRREALA